MASRSVTSVQASTGTSAPFPGSGDMEGLTVLPPTRFQSSPDHSTSTAPRRSRTSRNQFASTAESDKNRRQIRECAQRWLREQDPGAGWQLIEFLSSADPDARILAAELLAETEDSSLRARDLRRAKRRFSNCTGCCSEPLNDPAEDSNANTPYGLGVIESCMDCKPHNGASFCNLSRQGLQSLSSISHFTTFPRSALLFIEGQEARGAYVLCSGRVKLSTTSKEGKVLILKYAEPGEVLGLSAVLIGQPFELTAETAVPCQVNFIERDALIQRIEQSGELGLRVALSLSREFRSAQRDIHDLVLARSSSGKLAKLLLSWANHRNKEGSSEVRIGTTATHEQMAQMIGSSRETVTRLMGELRKKDVIRLEGSTLVIRNLSALQVLAA